MTFTLARYSGQVKRDVPVAELFAVNWRYYREGTCHGAVCQTPAGYTVCYVVDEKSKQRIWTGNGGRELSERQATDIIRHSRRWWQGDAKAIALVTGDWRPEAQEQDQGLF